MAGAFTDEVIRWAVNLHSSVGRTPWKYNPSTDKQRKFLSAHIAPETLEKIDRGAAMQLIEMLIAQDRDARAWRPIRGLESH